jgi:hypothetical protein
MFDLHANLPECSYYVNQELAIRNVVAKRNDKNMCACKREQWFLLFSIVK